MESRRCRSGGRGVDRYPFENFDRVFEPHRTRESTTRSIRKRAANEYRLSTNRTRKNGKRRRERRNRVSDRSEKDENRSTRCSFETSRRRLFSFARNHIRVMQLTSPMHRPSLECSRTYTEFYFFLSLSFSSFFSFLSTLAPSHGAVRVLLSRRSRGRCARTYTLSRTYLAARFARVLSSPFRDNEPNDISFPLSVFFPFVAVNANLRRPSFDGRSYSEGIFFFSSFRLR